jgi:uncharacterized protein with ParB-like and HNH nuclease domain
VEKFYFSLIIVDEEANPWEVFMALNTTGVELNISDLVKSLFISQSETKYEQQRIFEIWSNDVVKKFVFRLKKLIHKWRRFYFTFEWLNLE